MKLAALLIAALGAAQTLSVDAVVARLDQYLEAYEPKLSELIADEIMIQDVNRSDKRGGAAPSDLPVMTRQRRRLKSEVAFIALPGGAGWLGFRNVKTRNDRKVKDAGSLSRALGETGGLDSARRLLTASAEHNLGLPRTTNLPNLPLEFLHRRNRQRFVVRADGQEMVRGISTSRVVFLERMTPTMIRNRDTGTDRPSVVRAWIDPRDGRLMRAQVDTFASGEAKQSENSISVEFAENKKLGLLVPKEMRETFPADAPLRGTSVAQYSNYRRFQTSARIVQ